MYYYKGEVIDFRLFRATELAFGILKLIGGTQSLTTGAGNAFFENLLWSAAEQICCWLCAF